MGVTVGTVVTLAKASANIATGVYLDTVVACMAAVGLDTDS